MNTNYRLIGFNDPELFIKKKDEIFGTLKKADIEYQLVIAVEADAVSLKPDELEAIRYVETIGNVTITADEVDDDSVEENNELEEHENANEAVKNDPEAVDACSEEKCCNCGNECKECISEELQVAAFDPMIMEIYKTVHDQHLITIDIHNKLSFIFQFIKTDRKWKKRIRKCLKSVGDMVNDLDRKVADNTVKLSDELTAQTHSLESTMLGYVSDIAYTIPYDDKRKRKSKKGKKK